MLSIDRLALGISAPHGTPLVPAFQTHRLISRAIELGVVCFDTGPSYGAGLAEQRLGEAIRDVPRESVRISTKAGLTSAGLTRRSRDFSPDAILRSIEASFDRLQVDYLDTLFLHGPSPHELTDDLIRPLADLKASGRIRRLGVTGIVANFEAAAATGLFEDFMTPLNAWVSEPELAAIHGVMPENGRIIAIKVLGPVLHRTSSFRSAGGLWRCGRSLLRPERPDREHGHDIPSTPEEAIRWTLETGRADICLMTTTHMSHLEANAAVFAQ